MVHCRTDQVISRPKLKIFIPKNYALNYSNHLLKGQGIRLLCRFDQKINKRWELPTQSMVMDNDYSFNKNRYNFSLFLLKIFQYKEIWSLYMWYILKKVVLLQKEKRIFFFVSSLNIWRFRKKLVPSSIHLQNFVTL